MKTESQTDQVLAMLQSGMIVTPASIYEQTGSLAGHSRISELRDRGFDIRCTVRHRGRVKWGEYRLAQKMEAA